MEVLSSDLEKEALRVSHYFDEVGVLVHHRLVDVDSLITFMCGSIVETWRVLLPFIEGERARRTNGIYQEYFEKLTVVAEKHPVERTLKQR